MKILLATDGSSVAENAAKLIARLPHGDRIEVFVLYVNATHELHVAEIPSDVLLQIDDRQQKRGAETCQRIVEMFEGSNSTIETRLVQGHPSLTIVQQAADVKADLIVMGALGHSRMERILLGSTSDFVATHAPCSVLIVRPHLIEELSHHEPRICIAFDNSEPCRAAIDGFAQFGWINQQSIDIVSVVPTPFVYSDVPIQIDRSASRQSARNSLDQGVALCQKITSNVKSHLVESDHIGEGVVQFVKDNNSDIVVLGDTGRSLLGRFFMGSVSRYVLRHASCSVWIGRPRV